MRVLTDAQKLAAAARQHTHYKTHPERCNAATTKYRLKNLDVCNARCARWRKDNPEKFLFYSARRRARKEGLPFSIMVEDICIPSICPVIGIPLFKSATVSGPNSPTLDRFWPKRGYIKGNVFVISNKANRIKSDETSPEVFRMIARWLEGKRAC